MISELNARSREIFKYIVASYLETGEPVGSRTISKVLNLSLSPASIRNTMADLEDLGLLHAPHVSAGRLPTEQGLRLYVNGFMEMGNLNEEERKNFEATCSVKGLTLNEMINQASGMLSNLSACASLVIAPEIEDSIRKIQFVSLEPGKALIVLVMQNGLVENRIMDVPKDLPDSALISASNYLNHHLAGKSLVEARKNILQEIAQNKAQIDNIASELVTKGIALPMTRTAGHIIIRGQSKLLEDVRALADLERARTLMGFLEEQNNILQILDSVNAAQGVQIFIGAENKIFDQSGWSLIVSPYKNAQQKIIGAIGVIGPTRLDYDRIIPMVDYTSQLISRLVEEN
jgi:heat-inducible transcriptional repressor